MRRLGLGLRLMLESGPHVVGRLESGVWVRASFKIFVLTTDEMSYVVRELSWGNVRGNMSEGGTSCCTQTAGYFQNTCATWLESAIKNRDNIIEGLLKEVGRWKSSDFVASVISTRSSAVAERPRDASCH